MKKKSELIFLLLAAGIFMCCPTHFIHAKSNTITPVTYNISQQQGQINFNKAKNLKHEVKFMILRAENGGNYSDNQFRHNSYELRQTNIPYGASDYSFYANPAQAKEEAINLYHRAPQASFYVNDSEKNYAGRSFNRSTQEWADEIKSISRKPAILHSNLSFINHNFSNKTRNQYNTLWPADFSYEPDPKWHYDLWQYTDDHYSPALKETVSASVIPYGGRNIKFWTQRSIIRKNNRRHVNKHIIKKRIIRRVHPNYAYRHTTPHKYINPNYYRSSNIKHFEIISRYGTNIYDLYSHYIRHFKRGSILNVSYLKPYRYEKNDYHTIAITYYHHRPIMFTANRFVVRPYYYRK